MSGPLRVVVIGAGPAGLALAQGLHRAGTDVVVYERDAALDARSQGYRILLNNAGWASLRACLPEPVLALAEATSGELHGPTTRYDHRLETLGTWATAASDDLHPVDRAVLRHVLMHGIAERVTFGRRFSRVEEDGDRVRVVFDDGSADVGDVVVGADGAFSGVRGQLHPEIGFVRSELVAAMGRTPVDDRFALLASGSGARIEAPGLNLTVAPMLFRTPPSYASPELPATESYLRWLLMLPPDHPVAEAARRKADQTVTGTDARDTVLGLIEGWHPLVRDLIEHSSAHNGWMVTPKLLDRPLPPWDTERVTLLGDAAHLTLPSGGNGLATALRDAATLLEHLTGTDDTVAGLRAYQREMLVYGQAAVEVGVDRQRHVVPERVTDSPRPS
ncbi:FAD-dependent monooxygenase [Actinomycetospora endophytica]|uniref:FAD-dependent monooxygenase n=1 Tax=Actinomycetospora endophytica TaxID=2291215 RepID=A0ABS8P1U9_9PSEU|nr:NAD(P)/FAD-dependent oxidoreductase [Actinomycetospora endophytica]MCD2192064.1 FAD-dependent monooxygenase [Actinomycetospora endophytica]